MKNKGYRLSNWVHDDFYLFINLFFKYKMISVIIPSYNNKDYLELCINSLKKLIL